MDGILDRGKNFIWENARLLERSIFEYRFLGGRSEHVLTVLRSYQNPDGGFGHALEPDLRAPDSQPLFVEFGLRTLYECGLRDTNLTGRVCDFLAQYADLRLGIPTIFASSQLYPRAGHWNGPGAQQPSFERLTGLVGLALWQGVSHVWLQQAAQICLDFVASKRLEDAHTIQNAFCLVESQSGRESSSQLFEKLAGDLARASFFCAEAPVKTYGLTPLHFAPSPDAYCRPLFTDRQIAGHLEELAAQQQEDGGWPILWTPPGEMARLEWRAYATLRALSILRAYGKI